MIENGLVPVHVGRHRNFFWRRFASFGFAQGMAGCPIVISEISRIASAFPIVFQRRGDDFIPTALFSVAAGIASPFVDPKGHWRAPYVPSALRSYPFYAGPSRNSDVPAVQKLCLYVDENSGLLTRDPQDNPFFTDQNKLTRDLQDVLQFLQHREAAAVTTHRLCTLLAEMELFIPLQDFEGIALPPACWGIDRKKLNRVPDVFNLTLIKNDAFELIHAHQISLLLCAWLAQAQRGSEYNHSSSSDTLNGFLTAMANDIAHDHTNAEPINEMG